jgi:hypothetical protein
MEALGRMCLVSPLEEMNEMFGFQIRRKIRRGTLISKGNDCPESLEVNQEVYFRDGGHRIIGDHLIMSHKSIVGYAQ